MSARQFSPPPVAFVRECFTVDDAGALVWRHRPSAHFGNAQAAAAFNSTWAGNRACRLDAAGYRSVFVRFAGRRMCLLAHRVVWALQTGAWPVNQIDHIDRDRANNRFVNLRDVTQDENHRNRLALKSPATGVRPRGARFAAYAGRGRGSYIHLGTFETVEQASAARAAFVRASA